MDQLFKDLNPKVLAKFKEYHQRNPHIFAEFKKLAFQMKGRRSRYSAKAIIEVLRWNTAISGDDDFKINNNYSPIYARLMVYNHPEFKGFFQLRTGGERS